MGSSQLFSLRWNNYLRHITGAFDSLRTDEDLVDVTLSCEGKKIRAHKMLLSACSSYFRDLFKENPCQHPVIIFRDVKYQDLEALVDFMYQGEVNVVQEQLTSFLNTAELLAVQGLTDGSSKDGTESDTSDMKTSEDSQPAIAIQPEVKKPSTSVANSSVAANVAVINSSVNNRKGPDSPIAKKRKCSSDVVSASVNNLNKEDNKKSSELESVEAIPVLPNVKVEQPDYFEQESVGQYSDSVRDQSVVSGNIDAIVKEEKKDSGDYSSNSSDKNQHTNPLLDIRLDSSELYITNKRRPHTFMKPEGPGRKQRKICTGCYRNLRQTMNSRDADKKVRRIISYCSDCVGQPGFCLPCFNRFHTS